MGELAQAKRVIEFLEFLLDRQENKIVVVSHGDFLIWITDRYMKNVETCTLSKRELREVQTRLEKLFPEAAKQSPARIDSSAPEASTPGLSMQSDKMKTEEEAAT